MPLKLPPKEVPLADRIGDRPWWLTLLGISVPLILFLIGHLIVVPVHG